jgi:hypothetical protein
VQGDEGRAAARVLHDADVEENGSWTMLCEAGLAYQVGTNISLQCSAGTEQSLIRSKHLVRASTKARAKPAMSRAGTWLSNIAASFHAASAILDPQRASG